MSVACSRSKKKKKKAGCKKEREIERGKGFLRAPRRNVATAKKKKKKKYWHALHLAGGGCLGQGGPATYFAPIVSIYMPTFYRTYDLPHLCLQPRSETA